MADTEESLRYKKQRKIKKIYDRESYFNKINVMVP
jgi:hypothetical protein